MCSSIITHVVVQAASESQKVCFGAPAPETEHSSASLSKSPFSHSSHSGLAIPFIPGAYLAGGGRSAASRQASSVSIAGKGAMSRQHSAVSSCLGLTPRAARGLSRWVRRGERRDSGGRRAYSEL